MPRLLDLAVNVASIGLAIVVVLGPLWVWRAARKRQKKQHQGVIEDGRHRIN